MSEVIDLGQDEGTGTVKVAGAEIQIDFVSTYNKLQDYHKANSGKSADEYNAGVCELMMMWGFPPVSQNVACRFVAAINKAIADLAKKNWTPAELAGSTGSAPS